MHYVYEVGDDGTYTYFTRAEGSLDWEEGEGSTAIADQ